MPEKFPETLDTNNSVETVTSSTEQALAIVTSEMGADINRSYDQRQTTRLDQLGFRFYHELPEELSGEGTNNAVPAEPSYQLINPSNYKDRDTTLNSVKGVIAQNLRLRGVADSQIVAAQHLLEAKAKELLRSYMDSRDDFIMARLIKEQAINHADLKELFRAEKDLSRLMLISDLLTANQQGHIPDERAEATLLEYPQYQKLKTALAQSEIKFPDIRTDINKAVSEIYHDLVFNQAVLSPSIHFRNQSLTATSVSEFVYRYPLSKDGSVHQEKKIGGLTRDKWETEMEEGIRQSLESIGFINIPVLLVKRFRETLSQAYVVEAKKVLALSRYEKFTRKIKNSFKGFVKRHA